MAYNCVVLKCLVNEFSSDPACFPWRKAASVCGLIPRLLQRKAKLPFWTLPELEPMVPFFMTRWQTECAQALTEGYTDVLQSLLKFLALWDQHRNAKHPRLLRSKSLPVKKWHKILHTSNAQCCKLLVHKNCSQMCPSTGSAHHESFFKAVHILMNANMFANIMKIVFPTEHCEVIWIKYVPLDMSVCRWSRSDLCFICGLGAAAECGHVLYENWLWKALTRCHLSRLPLVLNLCIWIWEAETLAEQKSHGKVSWGDEIQYQNFNYFIIVGQRLTQKEDHNGNGCITGPQHAGKWWHFNHHGATNPRGGSALVS